MKKITYELNTLSSLIISPRANLAFYKDLEQFSANVCVDERIKVVYPFYQYGMYTEYNPEKAQYYLPGSSIKGALNSNNCHIKNLMVDDLPIKKDDIVLRNLYKAQYLNDETNAKFDKFFENVGVEMVKKGTKLTGEVWVDELSDFETLLIAASESTNIKIKQMRNYLGNLSKVEKLYKELNDISKKLLGINNEKNVFLIGGFKGLLHSMELHENDKHTGAIFIDEETKLPHGLVTIEIKDDLAETNANSINNTEF